MGLKIRSAPFHSDRMSLHSLRASSIRLGLLCFGLLLFSTVMAHASCEGANFIVSFIVTAMNAKTTPADIETQLQDTMMDPQERACVRLALIRFYRSQPAALAASSTPPGPSTPPGTRPTYPTFGPDDTLTREERFTQETASEALYYKECGAAACNQEVKIFQLLKDTCLELETDKTKCNLSRKGVNGFRTPRPGWRKGIGGVMIGVGALGVILGGVHLGIPLFVRADSCVQNGLLFPCVADRYGVGGAVLGVGLLSIGGGILTLALP